MLGLDARTHPADRVAGEREAAQIEACRRAAFVSELQLQSALSRPWPANSATIPDGSPWMRAALAASCAATAGAKG